MARLLVARGIQNAQQASKFLNPSLADLHSPYLMTGLRAAVERLRAAIDCGETVFIYGDYDVDGTTAIVILKTALELCGGKVDYHVPHRIREGYGMRDEVIEQAAESGIRIIISVDTGIRAFAAAETAQRLGVDLIVTDHHLPHSEGVPKALAVVNPNQQGCEYPCKSLCGAGVAFKIAQALLEETGRARLLPSFLKMVAIATIADAVPLVGENRVFARLGLDGLRKPVNAGLRALLANCDLDGSRPLSAGDIAFRVAPRLNAAGRMDVAERVIRLFTEKDAAKAAEMAMELNQLNGDRQQEEQRIIEEIHARIEASSELKEAYCLVVEGEGWHRGVIGICASRVVERWRRPTLVFSCENGEAHGSGRSIPAFHLLQSAGVQSGVVRPLWRTFARRRVRASRRAHSRVTFAAGCLCPAATDAGGLRPGSGIRRRDRAGRDYERFLAGAAEAGAVRGGQPSARVRGQEFQARSAGSDAEGKAHQAASGAR